MSCKESLPHTLIHLNVSAGGAGCGLRARVYEEYARADGHRKKNGKNLCFCCNCIHIDYKNRHVQATRRLFRYVGELK